MDWFLHYRDLRQRIKEKRVKESPEHRFTLISLKFLFLFKDFKRGHSYNNNNDNNNNNKFTNVTQF